MQTSDLDDGIVVFHVIVACHNRCNLTLRAARSVLLQDAAGLDVHLTVFDDGSTDGTSEELRALDLGIRLLRGQGNAFWALGMQRAESVVLSDVATVSDADWVVWLNDDVDLDADAFERLRAAVRAYPDRLIVGSMRDPVSGLVSYAGFDRHGFHPLAFRQALPSADEFVSVETFNGNLVAVPVRTARRLGGIDGGFSHGLADIDYGLRAHRLGVRVVLAPGTFGSCARNPADNRGSIIERWRRFVGPKGGGNFRSVSRFGLRHSPLRFIPALLISYLLWWVRALAGGRE